MDDIGLIEGLRWLGGSLATIFLGLLLQDPFYKVMAMNSAYWAGRKSARDERLAREASFFFASPATLAPPMIYAGITALWLLAAAAAVLFVYDELIANPSIAGPIPFEFVRWAMRVLIVGIAVYASAEFSQMHRLNKIWQRILHSTAPAPQAVPDTIKPAVPTSN